MQKDFLKGKRVMVMGLGILGGGVATTRFLVNHGGIVTVNDIKSEEYLKPSLDKLADVKDKIKFLFDGHKEEYFLDQDIIVVNPDVPKNNKYILFAKERGAQIENELTLFFKYFPIEDAIAVTGTRGKTTAVNWIKHFWKSIDDGVVIKGNSPTAPLLEEGGEEFRNVILECPSYLIEYPSGYAPKVCLITNIYVDHLNRYDGQEDYARTKANIFLSQNENESLVLNYDNTPWTEYFLSLKPKAKTFFFSKNKLPENLSGMFVDNGKIYLRDGEIKEVADADSFVSKWGEHNLENLLSSMLSVYLVGVPLPNIIESIETLPNVYMRQETIYKDNNVEVINDTTGTSPEACFAAIRRFNKNKDALFIIGGTDKDLDFSHFGETLKGLVEKDQLVFITGTATEKMLESLGYKKKEVNFFESLEDCVVFAKNKLSEGYNKIVLSPGAKSFGLFRNEFDRGEKFIELVKKYFG
jgi:UDP-N-acetylmuramoylalanine--D-glutamate ligase